MNSHLEENKDAYQEMYETPNKGTTLEPKSLQTKAWHVGYWVSPMEIGAIREVWIGGPQKHLSYRKRFPMKGIKFDVYPRKGGIHAFQAPSTIQEHGEERNPRDKLLLANLINSSNPKFMNSWHSDYNGCTNVPFVYQSTSLEYHEPIKD